MPERDKLLASVRAMEKIMQNAKRVAQEIREEREKEEAASRTASK